MHCVLACMVLSGVNSKYEELRTTYNSVIDDGDRRIPPQEEWRGMTSICDHIFCRWVAVSGVLMRRSHYAVVWWYVGRCLPGDIFSARIFMKPVAPRAAFVC